MAMELGRFADLGYFSGPLHKMNGDDKWALNLTRLPEGLRYQGALDQELEATAFIQAGGSADCMTIEIRQPGGHEWGVESVWSVVGHASADRQERDVPIKLPRSTQMISEAEVFDADEAADLFFQYYKTGQLPAGYALRPLQGWKADGTPVDLRGKIS
ncbi:hypothetical protein AWB94_25930 [Mycolicibacterium canariasense]|nr:hypothetical protein AWB94_25930 [Mycolicibacterium canariasense]